MVLVKCRTSATQKHYIWSREELGNQRLRLLGDAAQLWPQFNTLTPRQNYRHFADDIFKCIFLNEDVWSSLKV